MSKIIDLHFSPHAKSPEVPPPRSPDPEALLDRAINGRFISIHLDWAGLFKCFVPVEDDVMFIAMAYSELGLLSAANPDHRVFLGDGLFDVRSRLDNNIVEMVVRYCPHLDARFLQMKTLTVDALSYREGWSGLMRELVARVDA